MDFMVAWLGVIPITRYIFKTKIGKKKKRISSKQPYPKTYTPTTGGEQKMNYMKATIFLAFLSFINLILAVSFNLVFVHLYTELRAASNMTGVYEQVNPHLINIQLIFWLMFVFSAVGAIVWYILGSHREEFEEYRG